MYGLAKIAMASFDARRNKQYWQLLKRMYGGSDEAVGAIKKSGNPNIYHGTKSQNVKEIMEEGLIAGGKETSGRDGLNNTWFKEFGDNNGIFFGDHREGMRYSRGSNEGLLRLKRPSELKDTKTLYPNVSKAKTTEIDGPSKELMGGNTMTFKDQLHLRAKTEFEESKKGRVFIEKRRQELQGDPNAEEILNKEIWGMTNPFSDQSKWSKVQYFGRKDTGAPSVSDWDGKQFHYKGVDAIPPSLLKRTNTNRTPEVKEAPQVQVEEQVKNNVERKLMPWLIGGTSVGVGGLAYLAAKRNKEKEEV